MSCATSGPTVNVEMHINDLADFVFRKNIYDSEIYLQLFEVEDMQDLFFFCLDLFCKGLVLLYGDKNRVCLEELTMDQFLEVRRKLRLAGIDILLDVEPQEPVEGEAIPPVTMIRVVEKTDNVKLEDYNFHMQTPTMKYTIRFSLTQERK